jgi:hypothetical protein
MSKSVNKNRDKKGEDDVFGCKNAESVVLVTEQMLQLFVLEKKMLFLVMNMMNLHTYCLAKENVGGRLVNSFVVVSKSLRGRGDTWRFFRRSKSKTTDKLLL